MCAVIQTNWKVIKTDHARIKTEWFKYSDTTYYFIFFSLIDLITAMFGYI